MRLKVTPVDLDRFVKRLGREEHGARQNYFRWLEYPLSLSLLGADEGDSVLEIGSGYVAATSLFLASKGCRVVASDLKPIDDGIRSYVEGLRGNLGIDPQRLEVARSDGRDLDFESGRFERLLCVSMLEHVMPFDDALIAGQIGRVLADDGVAVITVPFNHGEHIEPGLDEAGEYTQRHYNEYTIRERILAPSSLHLERAVFFGELDYDVGLKWRGMDRPDQTAFCSRNLRNWQRFWTIYYEIGPGDFYIDRDRVPQHVQRSAGLVALVLRKAPLTQTVWGKYVYDPIKSFRENSCYVRPFGEGSGGASLSDMQVHNMYGAPLEAFRSGETLVIRAEVHTRGNTGAVFRAIFEDDQRNTVAGLCVPLGDPMPIGRSRLELTFGMLNLGAGAYDLTLGLWDRERPDPLPPVPLDVHAPAARIVVGNDKPGLTGPAYLPFTARIEPA